MDAKLFLRQVSLIERFCILLFLISWFWKSSYSNLEALLVTVLSALVNWCYFVSSGADYNFPTFKLREGIDFDEYWDKAFWVERYALAQLLLGCWFPIADTAASTIVGISALFAFVCLPVIVANWGHNSHQLY